MQQNQQPDIRLFQSYRHKFNPFAKFDYMGVLPVKSSLDGFLRTCTLAREHGLSLSKTAKRCEEKAFISIQKNEYVTTDYPWQKVQTGYWRSTPETCWSDFLNQKKEWEKFEANEEKWFI